MVRCGVRCDVLCVCFYGRWTFFVCFYGPPIPRFFCFVDALLVLCLLIFFFVCLLACLFVRLFVRLLVRLFLRVVLC